MRCSVLGCKNTSKKKDAELFYMFPSKEPELFKKWISFCRRPEDFYDRKSRICGVHFRAKDKERNLQYEMGFKKARCPTLKPGTVPCIYMKDEPVKVIRSKKGDLGSFPSVMLEEDSENSQQSLCKDEYNNPEYDPLSVEEERKKVAIALVKLNGEQTINQAATINKPNEISGTLQPAFKGLLAVLYPVDEKGTVCHNLLTENLKKQGINFSSVQPTTTPNEDPLKQLKKLEQENKSLRKKEERYKKTIKDLEKKLIVSDYAKNNLENKLKTIFSSNQIRQLKTGKRVFWSEEDMIKSTALYKKSASAYRMLKSQNYPIPSQKTVQVWIQNSRQQTEKQTELLEKQQNNIPEGCDIEHADLISNSYQSTTIQSEMVQEEQNYTPEGCEVRNEDLISNHETTMQSVMLNEEQNYIPENMFCSHNRVIDEHSYFNVVD